MVRTVDDASLFACVKFKVTLTLYNNSQTYIYIIYSIDLVFLILLSFSMVYICVYIYNM